MGERVLPAEWIYRVTYLENAEHVVRRCMQLVGNEIERYFATRRITYRKMLADKRLTGEEKRYLKQMIEWGVWDD